MARTAVVAGTATAVSGNVQRRGAARRDQQADAAAYQQMQQQAAAAQAAAAQVAGQPPAAAPPAQADDPIAKLKELAELKSAGVLTDEEFATMKAKILAG